MSILWLIIKIILMILLGICGGIFGIVAVVLIAPIRYEAYWAKYETLAYDIKMTYLGGIKAIFFLENEEKKHQISVFGKILYKNEEVEEPEAKSTKRSLQKKSADTKGNPSDQVRKVKSKPKKEMDKKQKANMPSSKKVIDEKKVNPQLKREAKEETIEVGDFIKEETIETVKEMPNAWIKKILFEHQTYRAIKRCIQCLWDMGLIIWPKQWDFELVIGKEDSAETGELIARLIMLYPLYYKHGVIRGNYEKPGVEGGFLLKGHFRLGSLLWQLIKCICSESVRRFIQFVIRIRKEERYGK